MGAAATAAPSTKTEDWSAGRRSSPHSQRYSLDAAHRGSLAGAARPLWPVAYRGQSLLSLAAGWDLGAAVSGGASPSRCRWPDQLARLLCRWHHVPRPPTCGGGKKRDPETEALGRSRGGFSTKVHLRAEGDGQLMTRVLTPGQRHEAVVFEPLMESGAIKRRGPGRPKRRPYRVIGDKGYSSGKIRQYARQHGMRITIPRKQNEHRTGPFDRALYRLRNRIERLINRCKQFRRLATRYEKRAVYFQAMWLITATVLWLRVL